MRKFLIVFFSFGLLTCNDGDIITLELDFEDTFEQCGELVFYKTKDDPSESLSIEFTSSTITGIENFLAVGANGEATSDELPIVFNYRTYNTVLPNNYFCNDIPDSSVSIESDEQSDESDAVITTVLVEDDNDGIPAELEDINGDGDLDNDDTDGDGLPNYLDDDDDGDNVPTASENPDPNNDGNLDDAQNTDADSPTGDTIPDYLDSDDDGDGVLTRDEETESQDQNPTNDIDNANIGPDYLNDMFSMSIPATAYREHSILQTYTISCEVRNISLPSITQNVLDFGSLTPSTGSGTITTRTVTPDF